MRRPFICLVLLLAFSGIFVSCKKDNDDKKPVCRIVTITTSTGDVTNITYNNEGKISTLSEGGIIKVFTYAGNTIIINSNNGNFASRDSITTDSKGRPVNIRQFSDATNTKWTNLSFEYNGDDLLKYIQTTNPVTTPVTNTATYVNGNMVSLQFSGDHTDLEYYTDKKVQQGDLLELSTVLIYGVSIYPHKNLVKSISSGGSIANYSYEFNADGQITKATATGGTQVSTFTYQYQCN
jgi:hypothetical protein